MAMAAVLVEGLTKFIKIKTVTNLRVEFLYCFFFVKTFEALKTYFKPRHILVLHQTIEEFTKFIFLFLWCIRFEVEVMPFLFLAGGPFRRFLKVSKTLGRTAK